MTNNPAPNGPTGGSNNGADGGQGAGTGQQQAPANGPDNGGQGQGAGQQQGQQNDGGQQAQQQGGQAPQLGPDGQPWDPARAQTLIENLRAENQRLKQRGDQGGDGGQQQAAGQQGQGQAPAPQQNQQQPQQQGQQAGQAPADDGTADQLRAANTKIAILEHASTHGANPTALTDSMSFMAQVAKLDPDADDYKKKLGDAIKKAVADHPHYASGQAPGTSPRGGSDGTGRPGAPNRPKGLGGALRAHYASK